MMRHATRTRSRLTYRLLSAFIAFTFSFTTVAPPGYAQTGTGLGLSLLSLPAPGTMVTPSHAFVPVLLKGMTIHPENPLQFDFIIDSGNTDFKEDKIKAESERLVKYFLASMTIPKDDLWVNLSPYESDKIIPDELGKTELGRDMLAQDYILKQLTASLMYPEKELGKEFWNRVYQKAQEKYGTTEIPVDTFNKVWILPETATVYEHGQTVYIVEAKLRVMLDADYIASGQSSVASGQKSLNTEHLPLNTEIIREIILPEIEKEVNEGQNFAPLRQIYHSLILAKWYKETIKNSLLSKIYVDQKKIAGVNLDDATLKDQIYAQYMEAYKKGVFNYIKEDYDRLSNETIPRKYFSGGLKGDVEIDRTNSRSGIEESAVGENYQLAMEASPQKDGAAIAKKSRPPVSETEYKAGDKSGTVLELTSKSLMEMIESMIEQQVRVGVANPFEGPNVRVTYHKGPHLGEFVVQENPGRAPGERKAKAEASYDAGNGNPGIPHCFLCYLNIPKNEMAIRYKDGFLIYPNPAPFEKNHIVIAEQESEADRHPIQLLQTRKQVEAAVDLIEEVAVKNNHPGYNISFNSFGAADTSSHFHFQGFETGQFSILKKEIFSIRKNGVNIGFVDNPDVDAIAVEGSDKSKVIDEVLRIAQNFNKTFRPHFQELSAIGDEKSFKSDLSKRMGNPKTRDPEVIPYNVLFKAQQENGQVFFRVYFYPRLWETPQDADPRDAELLDTKFAVAELSGMYITHLHDRVNMITKEIMEKNLRLASFHNREDLISRILGFNEGEMQRLTEATEKKMSESFFVSSGLLASAEELLRFFENDENKLRAEIKKWISEYKEEMGVSVSDAQILKEEFFRLTDENGRYDGGIMPRDLAHAKKQWHRTVGAFAIDRQGNVLIQKRAADRAIKPGAYDVSVGGHAGLDDPRTAVAREIEEEIFNSKHSIDLSRLFALTADNEFVRNGEGQENASFFVYVLEEDEKEKVEKQKEVAALEWLGAEALDNLLQGYKGYAQDSDDPYAAGFLFFEDEVRKEALLDLTRRLRDGESIQEASSPIVLARDIESAEELIVQKKYEEALKIYKEAQAAVGTLSKKEVKKDDEAAEKKGEKIIRYLRELKEDIDERIVGLELAIAFEKNELTGERIQGLSSYQMVALLRILPLAEFSIPQKFILYSGAPGSGKGTLMEQTFDKKARFADIVGQLLLYHTRPARKGELDGKKYHFRLISVLKTLEQIGRIKRTAVNKQQQGVADEEFEEEVVVHPNVPSEALLRGDIVIRQGKKDLSEEKQWVVKDKKMAVQEETVVKRKIKGVKEAFGTDKITVMEGGYGWFLVLTKDPRYADIFTVFITPFEDDEIILRGKNQEIISAAFARPFDRFIAYSLMNVMRLERGKEKLDLQDPETLGDLRGKVEQWLQTWGAQESKPEMMRSLKRHETDEKPALKNNAVLIESDEFIEQINRSLKKYFGKADADLIKTDQQKALARALAYEVQMKLAGDVARGDTSFYLEIPTEQSEETGVFTRPEDMFNRVVEGVIQIMFRKDYYTGARAGKGLVVRNKFVYNKDQIKTQIEKMADDFSTAYFTYLLTAMAKEKGERGNTSSPVTSHDIRPQLIAKLQNTQGLERYIFYPGGFASIDILQADKKTAISEVFNKNSDIQHIIYFGDEFYIKESKGEKKIGNDTPLLKVKIPEGKNIHIFSVDENPEDRTDEAKEVTIWVGKGPQATQMVLQQILNAIQSREQTVVIHGSGPDANKSLTIDLRTFLNEGIFLLDVDGTVFERRGENFDNKTTIRDVFAGMLNFGLRMGIISGNSSVEQTPRISQPLSRIGANMQKFFMYVNGGATQLKFDRQGEMQQINLVNHIPQEDFHKIAGVIQEEAKNNFGLNPDEIKAWLQWFNIGQKGQLGKINDFPNVQFRMWLEDTNFVPDIINAQDIVTASDRAPLEISNPSIQVRDGISASIKLLPRSLEIQSSSPTTEQDQRPRGKDKGTASDEPGGIDMNSIGLDRQGMGVDIQFDPAQLQEIIDLGIDGLAPVIINITPLPSVLPLLGLDPVNKEEEQGELVNAS